MHSSLRKYNTDISTRSTSSHHSDDSQDTQSTTPTSLCSTRPSLHQAPTDRSIYSKPCDLSPAATYYPRSSTETYASGDSQEDLFLEPESYDPEFEVPEYRLREEVECNLRPSTASDFAQFFPSSKRLHIRHDDTTHDGNMNLRVDIEDSHGHSKSNVQLFHLRMHDLKKREFSLRRYERSSGREVCHSSRKYTKPAAEKRPATLTRSMSNAFASFRGGKPEFKRTDSTFSNYSSKSPRSVKRQDSGYGSSNDDDDDSLSSSPTKASVSIPTNTTRLEFSNYAQVDVKRRGAKSSKRYDFEYWGYTYTWKRVIEKDGQGQAISYHLCKGDGGPAVAHIVPEMRSPFQIRAEEAAGGWVPPCSVWISDESVLEALTDVADVIIATGLIALVDDCIKRHFHSKPRHQIGFPLTPLKLEMEFVGPKAMVEHMFKRRDSGASGKEREQKRSPLRFANPVAAF